MSFYLKCYYNILSNVIYETISYLPQQHIKNENNYIDFYIANYKDTHNKLLLDSGIEPQPYNNRHLGNF
ncbi:hypothetical protein DSECCO2_197670 [anaerobic digester metagenome]